MLPQTLQISKVKTHTALPVSVKDISIEYLYESGLSSEGCFLCLWVQTVYSRKRRGGEEYLIDQFTPKTNKGKILQSTLMWAPLLNIILKTTQQNDHCARSQALISTWHISNKCGYCGSMGRANLSLLHTSSFFWLRICMSLSINSTWLVMLASSLQWKTASFTSADGSSWDGLLHSTQNWTGSLTSIPSYTVGTIL